MANPAAIRAGVDGVLNVLWNTVIRPRQTTYFNANGHYWQGLRTRPTGSTPVDGVQLPPDSGRAPSDQAVSWNDLGIQLPNTMDFVLWIDAYNGPQGHGYAGSVLFIDNQGSGWTRTVNVGPETWRNRVWQRIPVEHLDE